jgi:hypothetical protein
MAEEEIPRNEVPARVNWQRGAKAVFRRQLGDPRSPNIEVEVISVSDDGHYAKVELPFGWWPRTRMISTRRLYPRIEFKK